MPAIKPTLYIGIDPGTMTGLAEIIDGQYRLITQMNIIRAMNHIRITHEQNLVLPHVKLDDAHAVFQALAAAGLATPEQDPARAPETDRRSQPRVRLETLFRF